VLEVITICFPAGAARVGNWNSSLGLHPSRGSCSAEVVLRPTFQTVLRQAVCGVSTESKGTNVLDVRVWGVGGVLFVVTCIVAQESVGEIASTVEHCV
jgi:hypothetical protein